jgi:signal transduction histidine kinase
MNAAFVPFRRRSQERTLWLVTLEPSDHAGEPRDLASRAAVTAGIVHDLRTPVQLVLGWASLLRRRPADVERIEHALTMIERNAELLTDLLEDLLDQTRMAATRTGRRVQRIDLLALLAAEVRAMQPIADAGGVRLTLVTDLSTLAVAGDAVELRRVVINLVDNALKFTPRNGVVECRLWRTGEWAALAVRDNGPGISPEFLPRIFDPFVQETGAVARRGEGVGLGLAVVRQLVEFHGGSVSVASAGSGCGTTFTVRLPVLVAPALVHHEGHVTGPTRPAFADARPATAARGA